MHKADNFTWPELYSLIFFQEHEILNILRSYVTNCNDDSKPFLIRIINSDIIGEEYHAFNKISLENLLNYYYCKMIIRLGCEYYYPIPELEEKYRLLETETPLCPDTGFYDEDVIDIFKEETETRYPNEVNHFFKTTASFARTMQLNQLFCLSDCMMMLRFFAKDVAFELSNKYPEGDKTKLSNPLKISLNDYTKTIHSLNSLKKFIKDKLRSLSCCTNLSATEINKFVNNVCIINGKLPFTKLYLAQRSVYKIHGGDPFTVIPDYSIILNLLEIKLESILTSDIKELPDLNETLYSPVLDKYLSHIEDYTNTGDDSTGDDDYIGEKDLPDGIETAFNKYLTFSTECANSNKRFEICSLCKDFNLCVKWLPKEKLSIVPTYYSDACYCNSVQASNLKQLRTFFDLGTWEENSEFAKFLIANTIDHYQDGGIDYFTEEKQVTENKFTYGYFIDAFNKNFKAHFFMRKNLKIIISTYFKNIEEIAEKDLIGKFKEAKDDFFILNPEIVKKLTSFPQKWLDSYAEFPKTYQPDATGESHSDIINVFEYIYGTDFVNPFDNQGKNTYYPGILIFRLMLLYLLHLTVTDDGTTLKIMSCLGFKYLL